MYKFQTCKIKYKNFVHKKVINIYFTKTVSFLKKKKEKFKRYKFKKTDKTNFIRKNRSWLKTCLIIAKPFFLKKGTEYVFLLILHVIRGFVVIELALFSTKNVFARNGTNCSDGSSIFFNL